jgi:arabinose operon protein AraL
LLFVFDLDGVIYRGKDTIPGAVPALQRIAEQGHSLFYLTNNSTASRASYAVRLTDLGIPTEPGQVMTSAYATGLYLRGQGGAGKKVFIIGEPGLAEEMQIAGLQVIPEGPDSQADFVVVGLDRQLTYAQLACAQRHVLGGARFIATNRDGTLPIEGGVEIPGSGSMVAALEACSRPAEITIGKPEPHTWRQILAFTATAPQQAVMIGDRAETDIRGARRVGLVTVLVLTGATRERDVPDLPAEDRPDHVIPSLGDLPTLVEQGALGVG